MIRSITVRVKRREIFIAVWDCASLIREKLHLIRFLLYTKNNYQPFLHAYDTCAFNIPTSTSI